MWTHEQLERRDDDVDGGLVNPPGLLEAPAGQTASGAVEYDYQASEATASAAIVEIAERHEDLDAPGTFAPVSLEEFEAAPNEAAISYELGLSVLRDAAPVEESSTPAATPRNPFGA